MNNAMYEDEIKILKNIFRRRIRHYQRSKNRIIIGNHSKYKDLKQRKDYYCSIKNELIDAINCFRANNEIIIDKPFMHIDNISFLSNNGDWLGKVFIYNGQILRGINAESVDKFFELWKTGIIQTLGNYGFFPQTTISDYYTDNYPIVLQHKAISKNTSKTWCFEMIKDACIQACLLRDVLEVFGYTLYDGHLNNMVFNRNTPVFIDIGSVVKNDSDRDGFSWELAFSGLYRMIFYLFGNNMLKHIQVYDEANNSIWIKPWNYDNALEEHYYFLKKYKAYGIIHNSILVNYLIFKVFDCYDLRPEYIDLLFTYKQTHIDLYVGDVENSDIVLALKDVQDVLGINIDSYYLIKKLAEIKDCNYRLIVDDDYIANTVYKREKECKGTIGVFLHNIMYSADDVSIQNIRSDLVIVENVTSNVTGFHSFKYDALVSNLAMISKKYLYVSIEGEDKEFLRELTDRFVIKEERYNNVGSINKKYIFCILKERENEKRNTDKKIWKST
ncbi:hypothetical protein NXH67_04910 [Butyrivibrio sp. DSM 10294]|uniref:hypothetical protein n=1 Tax=Butyrivibrio sp. DSM 10294 TaxID=2972457 RepID=UPI00234E97E4|nr:hypothetical protein [Butyrivibrio sp. DSM 10294]MDC7292852.1 hypothetical protein [Butyrivibrio sp. DSM 10294]